MAYIGQSPSIGNFQVCDAISTVNGQAAYTMQVSSVNVVPETANHMLVSLNGILQRPGSSFTVAGSTITFASNLVTGDVINFIHILGSVLDLGVPSDDTVTAAKINNNAISGKTALATEPADTDEFLVSDAGVLKRIDYSLIKGGGTHVLLSTANASSSSAVNFTSAIDSTYKSYLFELINVHMSDDGAGLQVRFYQGGSVDTGSVYDYCYARNVSNSSSTTAGNAGNSAYIQIVDSINANTAVSSASGRMFLFNPADTTFHTHVQFHMNATRDGDVMSSAVGSGRIDETAAVDGVSFFGSAGTIDSGIFKLYGIT